MSIERAIPDVIYLEMETLVDAIFYENCGIGDGQISVLDVLSNGRIFWSQELWNQEYK
jgi:hypothetical protein